jgi:hypothetical protein
METLKEKLTLISVYCEGCGGQHYIKKGEIFHCTRFMGNYIGVNNNGEIIQTSNYDEIRAFLKEERSFDEKK